MYSPSQTGALLQLINLNAPDGGRAGSAASASSAGEGWSDSWKVFIYDEFCRDVISPLLR